MAGFRRSSEQAAVNEAGAGFTGWGGGSEIEPASYPQHLFRLSRRSACSSFCNVS